MQICVIVVRFSIILILQIILPEHMPSRYGHSITSTTLAPGLTAVTMFGGCTKLDLQLSIDQRAMIADTAVLTLGEEVYPLHTIESTQCNLSSSSLHTPHMHNTHIIHLCAASLKELSATHQERDHAGFLLQNF